VSFTESCSACGNTFKVQEVDTGPWSWQEQEIECPYCKKVRTKKSSGTFKAFKLPDA
jgi:DNA-directed RNA polymerase subunit RPC12/RpoP